MWIRTSQHHINTDKIEHTEILAHGSIRLVFANGFIVLKDKEAQVVVKILDNVAAILILREENDGT